MPVKKTHEEYEEELLDKELDYIPLESYKGADTAILHGCYKGHEWFVTPTNILRGRGCPVCAGVVKKTTETYKAQIEVDAKPIEGYIDAGTPILHQCSRGHEWKVKPSHILQRHGCPKCNKVGSYNTTRFSRDRVLAESPGLLYCIVLVNTKTMQRECVKIGITKGTSNKDVLRRAKGFKGYEPRIQKEVKGTLEQVFNLEQQLHNQWRDYRYLDSHKFAGWTELFQIEKLPEILRSIPDKP